MHKLGFVLSNLGSSDLSYMLMKQSEKSLKSRNDLDIIYFFETVAPPCLLPPCAIMNVAELWGFNGTGIATNLSTAEKVIKCPTLKRKILYCWDLEWLRIPNKSFERLYEIYGHPELELFTRAADYVKPIQDAWNKKVKLLPNFDINAFLCPSQ